MGKPECRCHIFFVCRETKEKLELTVPQESQEHPYVLIIGNVTFYIAGYT